MGQQNVGRHHLGDRDHVVRVLFANWYGHVSVWTISVIVPSLLFGFMRNRFHSTYPAMALHMFYNAGYFLLTVGFPSLSRKHYPDPAVQAGEMRLGPVTLNQSADESCRCDQFWA